MKKIVMIMTFSPAYQEWANKPCPTTNCWTTSRGETVAIPGEDWQDLLLKALVENYSEYECEVWQPDFHADRVYSAQLQDRLVHRNFPGLRIKRWKRGKPVGENFSRPMLRWLRKQDSPDTVFLVPVNLYDVWVKKMILSVRFSHILYYNFLNTSLMLPRPLDPCQPLKAANRWLINREQKRWLGRVEHLLVANDNPGALSRLLEIYPGIRPHYFGWGLDLDFWKPVRSKAEARERLGVAPDKFMIVLAQRLVPPYQVDRFIEALARVRSGRESVCYVAGHGTREYEAWLRDLADSLGMKGRVLFVGRVPDEDLRDYFLAADLFADVPITTGGSGSAVKCMALGTPILHITAGYSYEFLKEQGAGIFVSPTDYEGWTRTLKEVMGGKEVKRVSRRAVEECFSWAATGRSLHQAIRQVLSDMP